MAHTLWCCGLIGVAVHRSWGFRKSPPPLLQKRRFSGRRQEGGGGRRSGGGEEGRREIQVLHGSSASLCPVVRQPCGCNSIPVVEIRRTNATVDGSMDDRGTA